MLVYGDDHERGIRRRRAGRGWSYWYPDGERVTDRTSIDRLNAVGLPPAYRDAWFSLDPNSHLQATGIDARGRKQYRYHSNFRAIKEAEKFERCIAFGLALPRLRAQVARDLQRREMCQRKAVAAVVRLLDIAVIRVGSERYARENGSYGATTLRTRHARIGKGRLRLRFVAKSGRRREIIVDDPVLARTVKRCQDLPGKHLVAYVDERNTVQPVSSSDVNNYLRNAMKGDFTAKQFRTWCASALAFHGLRAAERPITLTGIIKPVAEALGNTPAIARKSYIHPALLERHGRNLINELPSLRATKFLSANERGLLAFLESASNRKGHSNRPKK